MNRTKILIWIILILFATNVATIVSGLIYTSNRKKAEASKVEIPINRRIMFFEEQLDLEWDQRNMFREYLSTFNQNARLTTNRINILRYQMIDEMAGDNPDTEKLNKISNEIGDLHSQLKKATISYYMNMKNICNKEQQKRLHDLFRVMADPEGDINSFGRGRGRGQGMMRGRRGPWWMNEQQNENN